MLVFFFFKQKTAYEMRISDWSSDVCSSDLPAPARPPEGEAGQDHHDRPACGKLDKQAAGPADQQAAVDARQPGRDAPFGVGRTDDTSLRRDGDVAHRAVGEAETRSAERRVGEEGVSTCRTRWAPAH